MLSILLATDADKPQVNGVVTTVYATKKEIEKMGHNCVILSPNNRKTYKTNLYPDFNICLVSQKEIGRIIKTNKITHVHICTEGPVGLAVRLFCIKNNIRFTTSYHTRFPEYLKKMFFIPESITYCYMKWFHKKSSRVLVPTKKMYDILYTKGFSNIKIWNRGVDTHLFKPTGNNNKEQTLIYVGRVSIEKNIEEFLRINIPNTNKIVVGDGPQLRELKNKYNKVRFVGNKTGADLVDYYNKGSVFVFPSKTDTYGLVLLEALACGLPVVAFNEPGPVDIAATASRFNKLNTVFISNGDLEFTTKCAMKCGCPKLCRELAEHFSWHNSTKEFIKLITL